MVESFSSVTSWLWVTVSVTLLVQTTRMVASNATSQNITASDNTSDPTYTDTSSGPRYTEILDDNSTLSDNGTSINETIQSSHVTHKLSTSVHVTHDVTVTSEHTGLDFGTNVTLISTAVPQADTEQTDEDTTSRWQAGKKMTSSVMLGMAAGFGFILAVGVILCVSWICCCHRFCDPDRQKIAPTDLRDGGHGEVTARGRPPDDSEAGPDDPRIHPL